MRRDATSSNTSFGSVISTTVEEPTCCVKQALVYAKRGQTARHLHAHQEQFSFGTGRQKLDTYGKKMAVVRL